MSFCSRANVNHFEDLLEMVLNIVEDPKIFVKKMSVKPKLKCHPPVYPEGISTQGFEGAYLF